jgi:hypothetical protein
VPLNSVSAGGAQLAVLNLDVTAVPPLPAGFGLGDDQAFLVTLTDSTSGEQMSQVNIPLTFEYQLSQSDMDQANADVSRLRLATWSGETWVALSCISGGTVLDCTVPHLSLFALVIAPSPSDSLDYSLSDGWFYKETNGFNGAGDAGYSVFDDQAASLWTEFQRLGGVAHLGYPISNRFDYGGLPTQAFQRAALQWRPDLNEAVPLNILDELSARGDDPWLDSARNVPPLPADSSGTAFADSEDVMSQRLAMLDEYPQLRDFYESDPDPLTDFGLPVSVKTYGPFVALRLQRGVLQLWITDTPWASAGTVVTGNAGDLAKEAGLWPASGLIPAPPPVVASSDGD